MSSKILGNSPPVIDKDLIYYPTIFLDLPVQTKENEHEIRMWRAVLQRALYDMLYLGTNEEMLEFRKEAFEWFHFGEDFEEICELAEMKPRWVVYLFQKYLENPKWQPDMTPMKSDPTLFQAAKDCGLITP